MNDESAKVITPAAKPTREYVERFNAASKTSGKGYIIDEEATAEMVKAGKELKAERDEAAKAAKENNSIGAIAKALSGAGPVDVDAKKEADKILKEAKAEAAQIVADAKKDVKADVKK
jgi:regulator of protease activity HflC (stomatin/prohibitin superfamily)